MLQLTWFPLRGFSVIFEIVRHLHHLLERELMYQTVFCTGAIGQPTIYLDSDEALRPDTTRHPRVVRTTGIRLCCLFREYAADGRVRHVFLLGVTGLIICQQRRLRLCTISTSCCSDRCRRLLCFGLCFQISAALRLCDQIRVRWPYVAHAH